MKNKKELILFQDDDILIINKPAMLPVLPDGWDPDAPYLLQQLTEFFPNIMVVHRLDKITSGVMVFALNPDAHRNLNIQFEKHTTEKIYHAICVGSPAWTEHTAKHKLRINVGHSHRTVIDNGKGKPSETQLKRIKILYKHCLMEAIPKTGKTHQIRVHCMALGFPLLGDNLYSAPATELIDRPALHAWSLEFNHPSSGEKLIFSAPYPKDFEHALKKLEPVN